MPWPIGSLDNTIYFVDHVKKYVVFDQEESQQHIDGLMQKRRNSSALAMKVRPFCIKPWICHAT